jgi:predicted Ser/Thr protein kinase
MKGKHYKRKSTRRQKRAGSSAKRARGGGTLKNAQTGERYSLGSPLGEQSTNEIYVSKSNPNVLIKLIQKPKFGDAEMDAYSSDQIRNELRLAQHCHSLDLPVPKVYHTEFQEDEENFKGYIVMERIRGSIISSVAAFEDKFDKIYDALNELLSHGILQNDLNINNFIVKGGKVYVIDFEDVTDLNQMPLLESANIKLDKRDVRDKLYGSLLTKIEFATF